MDEKSGLNYEDLLNNINNIDNSRSILNPDMSRIRDNVQDFLEKETSEPDITFFLNSEPESKEGNEILRKCINYFLEKKWESLLHFLEIGGKYKK
jgi:hypothetical protein